MVKDPSASPERLAGSAELADKMKQALDALTPAERTAIVMRHWEGCAIEEIARCLKSNTNATKNTVFRAVSKLRKALEPFSEFREHGASHGNGIMNHMTEEELIAYRDGEIRERERVHGSSERVRRLPPRNGPYRGRVRRARRHACS